MSLKVKIVLYLPFYSVISVVVVVLPYCVARISSPKLNKACSEKKFLLCLLSVGTKPFSIKHDVGLCVSADVWNTVGRRRVFGAYIYVAVRMHLAP